MVPTVKIGFELSTGKDGGPTVADLRRWLAAVEAAGIEDDAELELDVTDQDDVAGFHVWR